VQGGLIFAVIAETGVIIRFITALMMHFAVLFWIPIMIILIGLAAIQYKERTTVK